MQARGVARGRDSDPPTPAVGRFLRLALDTPEPDVPGPAFARTSR